MRAPAVRRAAAMKKMGRNVAVYICAFAVILASVFAYTPSWASGQQDLTGIIRDTAPSVVGIIGKISKLSKGYSDGSDNIILGSGIVYKSNGYILTNYHVIGDCSRLYVILSDRKVYEARVCGVDEASDIALIKIDKGLLKPVVFADSSAVEVGTRVITIGTPLEFDLHNSVGLGIISGINRGNTGFTEYEFLQTDAVANPGSSGGPLVDMDGKVLGIVEGGFMYYSGITFCIPSRTIQYVASQLLDNGRVRRPGLGAELEQNLMADYGLSNEQGLYFKDIDPGGPLAQAGVTEDDVLLEVNGVPVNSFSDFAEELTRYLPGDSADLTVLRKGYREYVRITFAEVGGDSIKNTLLTGVGSGSSSGGGGNGSVVDISAVSRTYIGTAGIDATQESTKIRMRPGAKGFTCNGANGDSPEPKWVDGVLYLPLRAVAEAFGAYIGYSEGSGADAYPRITCKFKNRVFVFTPGAANLAIDGAESALEARDIKIGDATYVPASVFDSCMGTVTVYDGASDSIEICLNDDGRIRDLSEFLGEISESTVGNSYYNWSIDIPKKSILISATFNSDEITIYSPLRNAIIDITVTPSEGYPPEYYAENPDALPGIFHAESVEIVGTGHSRYVQTTQFGYGATALMRFYPRKPYDYSVTIHVLPDENGELAFQPYDFSLENPYTKILDSFQISNTVAGGRNFKDLSSVVDGKVEFINYLNIAESPSLLVPWTVSIPPQWRVLYDRYSVSNTLGASIRTIVGEDDDENLTVSVELNRDSMTIDDYYHDYVETVGARYNTGYYEQMDCGQKKLNGYDCLDLSYKISEGPRSYIFNERLFAVGKLLYRARLKTPERSFNADKNKYLGILDSYMVNPGDTDKILPYLLKQYSLLDKRRLSGEDGAVEVGSRQQGWGSKLPGQWLLLPQSGQSFFGLDTDAYCDITTGADILVTNVPVEIDEDDMMFDEPPADAPDMVVFGDNAYTESTFDEPFDIDPYDCDYPGFATAGAMYIYNCGEGAYIIITQIPAIYDTPFNTYAFEQFLTEFQVKPQPGAAGKSRISNVSENAGSQAAGPSRIGAVG